MSAFGWWYPAGAANDSNAPYNQGDPPPCVCGHPLEDHDGTGAEACLIVDCECGSFEEQEPEEPDEDRWGDD